MAIRSIWVSFRVGRVKSIAIACGFIQDGHSVEYLSFTARSLLCIAFSSGVFGSSRPPSFFYWIIFWAASFVHDQPKNQGYFPDNVLVVTTSEARRDLPNIVIFRRRSFLALSFTLFT